MSESKVMHIIKYTSHEEEELAMDEYDESLSCEQIEEIAKENAKILRADAIVYKAEYEIKLETLVQKKSMK